MNDLRTRCPLAAALDFVGDRWIMVILRDLFLGRKTFSEFISSPEGISNTVLSDRLKKMQAYGLIAFVRDPNDRKIKYYYMTDSGIDLYPTMFELMSWTKRNTEITFLKIAEDFFTAIDGKNRDDVIKESLESYKSEREELLAKTRSQPL